MRQVMLPSLLLLLSACGGGPNGPGGTIQIDGSSTIYPIAEAFAEEYQLANRGVRVTVGFSGTGGGFKRLCNGELDIAGASRPIRSDEIDLCAANGIEWVELPMALDGLSVVVHPDNDFVSCLTVEELRRVWEPESRARSWRDIRPTFPDGPLILYGPGTDSGTFDYFTEAIVGHAGASRTDYQASENDNILVQGIAGDLTSLGYFGYSYYLENRERVKVVAIDGGAGCVVPDEETIPTGTYAPLSRPLFFYVTREALRRPEVAGFFRFSLEYADILVPTTGYVPLPPSEYLEMLEALPPAPPPESAP